VNVCHFFNHKLSRNILFVSYLRLCIPGIANRMLAELFSSASENFYSYSWWSRRRVNTYALRSFEFGIGFKFLRNTGLLKKSISFQKFILQKLLTLNPGCGCCYLWHAATSMGRAGLSIWHLPRHTWGSHRVLIRCENNFESSPFSLYIASRHMFNSACKINFWKCILLFE
jgi:hypothetical protein